MEEQKVTRLEESKPAGGVFKGVWDFFASIKLTVILLIVLAVVSIIGTVIDQTEPAKNLKMLIDMFGAASAPGVLDFMVKVGLTNMYHSWWFVGLLLMLCANISVCTMERLPRVLHTVMTPQAPLTDESLRSLAFKREVRIKGDVNSLKRKAAEAVKAAGFSPKTAEVDGGFQYYAEKGRYSRLGVYITHISVLIIFVGALIGSFWGYKGYVQITEKQSVDSAGLINRPLLRKVGQDMPFGFSVRCDKFELKTYEGSQMPSDYLSTLTVIDNGREVLHKRIRVNDPMEYKGIRFFQSSYGVMPGMATMAIRANPRDAGSVREYEMKKGDTVTLDDGVKMTLSEMAPDVAIGQNNQLYARSDQFRGRAAAVLQFSDKAGNPVEQSVILNEAPDSQPKNIPYNFEIMNYDGPYYTGLQVTYDPGVWIVWTGCILMVLGILVAFFIFHKRVWVRLRPAEKGQVLVTVAGSTNKNRQAFESEFKRLVERLETK